MNLRQQRFVQEYLLYGNAAKAALTAGYAAGSARRIGSSLLRHPEVKAALAEEQDEAARRYKVDFDTLVATYASIALANMADYIDFSVEGFALRRGEFISPQATAAIAALTLGVDGKPAKIRLYDKLRSLDSLARLLGFGQGKAAPQAPSPEEVRAARERVRARMEEIIKERVAAITARSAAGQGAPPEDAANRGNDGGGA